MLVKIIKSMGGVWVVVQMSIMTASVHREWSGALLAFHLMGLSVSRFALGQKNRVRSSSRKSRGGTFAEDGKPRHLAQFTSSDERSRPFFVFAMAGLDILL